MKKITPPSFFQRELYLDAARGISILMVIVGHASHQISNLSFFTQEISAFGTAGVHIFFLISGVSLCLAYEHRKEKNIYFYIRRFFRIAPLYWLAILFYYYLSKNSYSQFEVITNFLFVQNIVGHREIVPGGWSIEVEMIFYFFFPLIFSLAKSYRFFFIIMVIFFITLIYYFLNILTWKFKILDQIYILIIHWHFIPFISFFMGISFFLRKFKFKDSYLNIIFLVLFFFISLISYNKLSSIKIINFYAAQTFFLSLFSIFLLLYLKYNCSNNMVILPFIGRYSFSLYICHQLVIQLVIKILNFANVRYEAELGFIFFLFLVLAISICISYLTYNIIEKKSINFGNFIIKKFKYK